MKYTCFVIMGYGKKKIPGTRSNIDLDKTYKYLIKPVLKKQGLVSVSDNENDKESFRADELHTTQEINKTFINYLNKADIVIADISALNQNAIYELGLRHAMKPKSTIIICDKVTLAKNNFFDVTFNPRIHYNSKKLEHYDERQKFHNCLSEIIVNCKNSEEHYTDSPVFSLNIKDTKDNSLNLNKSKNSLRSIINIGNEFIENEKYEEAFLIFKSIIKEYKYFDEQIFSSYILAFYKKDLSTSNLIDVLNEVKAYVDLENTTFEDILGITAAINLRLFDQTLESSYLNASINYYRKGSNYESDTIYCARNYCSTLLKIHMISDDINILKEYYYVAKHFAKVFLTQVSLHNGSDSYNNAWFLSNLNDLSFIATNSKEVPYEISYHSKRQKNTIENGKKILLDDLETIMNKIK